VGERGDARLGGGDGGRGGLQLGGGLGRALLRLLERFLREQVGGAGGLGLDADPLELGLGSGDQPGDAADLGRGGVLLRLGGTDLTVGGVRRRGRGGDGGRGGADEDGAGQGCDEQRPKAAGRAAHCRPGGTRTARSRRSGRTAKGHLIAPWGRGWRWGWSMKLEKSRSVTASHKGNTRHNRHTPSTSSSHRSLTERQVDIRA
jgi:hypothetical protein